MHIHQINSRDLPDLWFQAVHDILDGGKKFIVDKGSYAGQTRLEYDFFIGNIAYPATEPLLPDIPASCGIPNPVEQGYIYGGDGYERSYVEYLMTGLKQPGESYTYGERLTRYPVTGDKLKWLRSSNSDIIDVMAPDGRILFEEGPNLYLNQIELAIDIYKRHGFRNNQIILQVGHPTDMLLVDPPCLRHIDTRIQDDGSGPELRFNIYFRSWDLWGGLPANLAGIVELGKYMAGEIGLPEDALRSWTVSSKGLHLYGYAEDLAKLRCLRQ
jgi:thymidylate synthase